MKETLRPFMMKKLIIRMAVAAAIAAGCLLFTRFSIIDVIKGPVEIDMTEDPSKYEGKYVTTEVNYLITDYVEHMTETTYSYGGKTTSKNGNSYIAFYADDDYETMTSKWYYYSLYLPERKLAEANEMIDSTWEFWGDETNTALPPTPMRVTGTWEKLKGDVLRYYTETLRDDLGILEDGDDIFLLYTISADKIGGQPAGNFWLLMAVAALAILYMIVQAVKLCGKSYEKTIDSFIAKHPGTSLEYLESDFATARRIEKEKVWIGKKWTFYISGSKVYIFANREAVWAYYYRRTGQNPVSQMRVFMLNEKTHYISLSEPETQTALSYYAAEQPQMVIGYTAELEKMYQKDRQSFLNQKYYVAQQQMNDDIFGGYNY